MLEKVMEDKLKDVDTYDDMILEFKKLDKDKDGKIQWGGSGDDWGGGVGSIPSENECQVRVTPSYLA